MTTRVKSKSLAARLMQGLALLSLGWGSLALSSCSEGGGSSAIAPPIGPGSPSISITGLVPTALRLGDPFQFVLSAQIQTPGGIRGDSPVLITVAPPLGSRVGVLTLNAAQIPGCGGGSIVCTINNLPVMVTQVPLNVTGSYEVTISVLDQQSRVAQSSATITATL